MESKRSNDNLSVYGIFKSRTDIERAIDILKSKNFRNSDISVLLSAPDSTKEFAHVNSTKAPEGAVFGGSSGALVGGALGWLAGIGLIAIPGFGPFIAAGPLMGLLAGVGAGSVLGGITGSLVGLGIPEYEAKRYEGRIKQGGILLSVHADNAEWRDAAREVLEECCADDISSAKEEPSDYSEVEHARAHH